MKVIMTGGGTGGHIYPAIAIADKIKRREPDSEILFVGSKRGMENTLVPAAGYRLETIQVRGFFRKNLLKNFGVATDLLKSIKASLSIMDAVRPDVVIGTGGYVCGPVVLAARMRGIKTAIHEQNAFPGITNKMLGRFADKIFLGFKGSEKYFKNKDAVIFSGNPLRKEFMVTDSESDRKKLGISDKEFMILCFAGSGGAAKINEAMLHVIQEVNRMPEVKLFFAAGKYYYKQLAKAMEEQNVTSADNVMISEYIDHMFTYISAADIVVCRAGALTVSELVACGTPAVLIPSPNVTANHQFYNAKVVEEAGGGVIIEEKDLSGDKLVSTLIKLKSNREALNKMAQSSRKLAATDASDIIYENIKSLL